MKKKKIIFYVFLFTFLLFLVLGYGLIFYHSVSKERFQSDILKYADHDLLKKPITFSSTVHFQYLSVEEEVSNYVHSFYQQYQVVLNYTKDERLKSLLSVSNYLEDGPEFSSSCEYVEDVKNNFLKSMDQLLRYCSLKYIKNYAKKLELSSYYQDLFVHAILDSNIYVQLQNYKEHFLNRKEDMNQLFNTISQVFEFLSVHSSDWKIEDQEIQFSTEDLVNQYNHLVSTI